MMVRPSCVLSCLYVNSSSWSFVTTVRWFHINGINHEKNPLKGKQEEKTNKNKRCREWTCYLCCCSLWFIRNKRKAKLNAPWNIYFASQWSGIMFIIIQKNAQLRETAIENQIHGNTWWGSPNSRFCSAEQSDRKSHRNTKKHHHLQSARADRTLN